MLILLVSVFLACNSGAEWIEGDWASAEGATLGVHPPDCAAMGQTMACEVVVLQADRVELRVERGGRWLGFEVERADPEIRLHDGSVTVNYRRVD